MPQNPTEVAAQGSLYTEGVDIVNNYTFDPGICVLPLAEDPPVSEGELATYSPVVILKLHAPYRVRNVQYDTAKKNSPPIMPSPQSVGSFVFVGGSIVVTNALNSGGVIFNWQMQANYMFVENCASRIQDGLVLGSPPWTWIAYGNKTPTQVGTPIGASSHGGSEVLVGVAEAAAQLTGNPNNPAVPTGVKPNWIYTIPSFYGGGFFNDYIVNGGKPIIPPVRQLP